VAVGFGSQWMTDAGVVFRRYPASNVTNLSKARAKSAL